MLGSFCHSIAWLVLIGLAMSTLERWRPLQPAQRLLRSGFFTDLLYWLTPVFLYAPLAPRPLAAPLAALTGSHVFAHQPFWIQVLAAFVIGDFLSYWAHRLLHGRALWAFHAIHHGATELDWLSAARNHPVNVVLQRIVLTAPLLLIGIPVEAILFIAPFGAAYNIFTHANIDWRFGPLRYLLVSPVLHRWHHTPGIGCGRNFGETLAVWDVLFGTYYLPATVPQTLGLEDGPPEDFIGQTLWPASYFLEPAQERATA